MQSWYGPRFEREMGCVEREFRSWLPGATRNAPMADDGPGRIRLSLPAGGTLSLSLETLPPRQLGMARFPRLQVVFDFIDTADADRVAFMRYFDLFTQRGGG
ncbi:MAG: hypothetical protein ACKVQR_21505 [Aquabacterium sp.]